ncbi:MAG: hypothetical protein ACRDXE_01660 [Acidimicrobiales bacterium]
MSIRIGLWGARADGGGLAAMTHDFWRHMQPDETLVVDLGNAGRGPADPGRYPGARMVHGYNEAISEGAVRDFARAVDVVYAAETFYREDVAAIFADEDTPTVLHAMPELWRADMAQPTRVWVPTAWEADRMPAGTKIVPVPVDTQKYPDRAGAGRCARFTHLSAPAFYDRNGTAIVINALAHLKAHEPITVRFVGPGEPPPSYRNYYGTPIVLEHDPAGHHDRADIWGGDPAAFVMPRRYAGLSLPMQEAAALGLPIVSTHLIPQRLWLDPATTVEARPLRRVRMVGGTFDVYDADPADVAAAMSALAGDEHTAERARAASRAHARRLDWGEWTGPYRQMLEEAAR